MSDLPARESMEFDVVVVGAGPAGLATAIRLKQQAAEAGTEISVVVVEKGSEVGAHILSGAVIDPIGLDGLLPEWRSDPDRPLKTEVTADEFMYLGHAGGVRLPNVFMPKLMNNHGNFVGSLGNVARYLGRKAEELGVEIYPGFPAPRCWSRTARWSASPPATWASAATASPTPTSPAAWSCAPSTRSSARARAARSPSRWSSASA